MLAVFVAVALGISVPAADAHTILQRGDVGSDVVLWQKMLNLMFLAHNEQDPLLEDGIFGPATDRVTRAYERRFGDKVDGIVQQRERQNLLGGFITCCGAIKSTLGMGSYEFDVGFLQTQLNEWLRQEHLRHPQLVIDLMLGPRTEAVVRMYQDAHNLTVDGIAGLETWGELLGWPSP